MQDFEHGDGLHARGSSAHGVVCCACALVEWHKASGDERRYPEEGVRTGFEACEERGGGDLKRLKGEEMGEGAIEH